MIYSSTQPCIVHGTHSPKVLLTAFHHVIPESWIGGPGMAGATIVVCPTGHENIHVCIDALVAKKAMPRAAAAERLWASKGYAQAIAMGAIPRRTL